eukprot:COSAG04_NODE_512_length_13248_cov_51.630314_16_plen_118_part_00
MRCSASQHGRFLTFFLAEVRFHTAVSRCAAGCSETPCAARSGNRTGYSIPNPAEILVSELGTVSCAANYGGIAQVRQHTLCHLLHAEMLLTALERMGFGRKQAVALGQLTDSIEEHS